MAGQSGQAQRGPHRLAGTAVARRAGLPPRPGPADARAPREIPAYRPIAPGSANTRRAGRRRIGFQPVSFQRLIRPLSGATGCSETGCKPILTHAADRDRCSAYPAVSSMACHTVRIGVHVILVLEFLAQGGPIGRRRPLHVGHLVLRTQRRIRIAVAIQAPAHVQRLDGLRRLPFDPPVRGIPRSPLPR